MCWFALFLVARGFSVAPLCLAGPPNAGPPTAVLLEKRPPSDPKRELDFLREVDGRLKSKHFLETALRNPAVIKVAPEGPLSEAVHFLRNNLKIEAGPKKHTVRVSLPVGKPKLEGAAVNALVEACLKEFSEEYLAPKRLLLQSRLQLLKYHTDDLDTAIKLFNAFKDQRDLEEARMLQMLIAKRQTEINQLQFEIQEGPHRILLQKASMPQE